MTVIRRITATVLATVGTVLGLLAAASVAAASPVSPNDGNGFLTSVPQPPTGTPTNPVVDSGSPWWTFVLVAAAAVAVTLLVGLVVSRIRQHSTATQLAH
jgi:ABC-type branched-subunit amino acid transport system permease subunit